MSDRPALAQPLTRDVHIKTRAIEKDGERAVLGVAVPWNETITVWGERERFAPGSVEGDGAKLFARHRDAVGLITSSADNGTGWEIKGVFSDTATARDAYTLARDGVYDGLSVGFDIREYHYEHDEQLGTDVIVYDRVIVREVSLVPFPAYPSATVTEVREADRNRKENPPMGDQNTATPATAEDVAEIREALSDVQRSLTVLSDRPDGREAVVTDTRSAGEILKAIASGDEDTIRRYNELQERAYAGGTTADAAIKDGWVGDLTRIYDASTGVLADTFSTGTLPATGMNIEFAELDANSITVTKQENEGDPLPIGKVSLKTRTAPVETYGGATELTRQEIERSQLPILNRNLEALTMAAGVRNKAVLRAAYNAVVASQTAAGDVITTAAALTAESILDAVVDAALNFEDKAASIERLLVNASLFKGLNKLKINGTRIFSVNGNDKTVGNLDLTALRGDIASLEVRLDAGADRATDSGAFINGRALRNYTSSLVSLQDENIINLSKAFSVYRYGSVAAEIPGFIVPLKFA